MHGDSYHPEVIHFHNLPVWHEICDDAAVLLVPTIEKVDPTRRANPRVVDNAVQIIETAIVTIITVVQLFSHQTKGIGHFFFGCDVFSRTRSETKFVPPLAIPSLRNLTAIRSYSRLFRFPCHV